MRIRATNNNAFRYPGLREQAPRMLTQRGLASPRQSADNACAQVRFVHAGERTPSNRPSERRFLCCVEVEGRIWESRMLRLFCPTLGVSLALLLPLPATSLAARQRFPSLSLESANAAELQQGKPSTPLLVKLQVL